MNTKGIIFNIQKFCLQDGPGIRTTIFLKGCNIRCKWCHNPESFHGVPELLFIPWKCTHCGKCAAICPRKAHRMEGDNHLLDREQCSACGLCEENCMAQALKIAGKVISVREVIEEIKKDKIYYLESGGGVTFSGGEASVQYEFLLELLKNCKEEGIHTALETNGIMGKEKLLELSQYTDLFLFDYKLSSREEYLRWTGSEGKEIEDNLKFLNQWEKEVILRCPIIPGINDTSEHFSAIRDLKHRYSNISSVEIMPYHDTGKSKWESAGLSYTLGHIKTASEQEKKSWNLELEDE